MTIQDAAALAQIYEAKRRILNDDSTDLWGKSQAMAAIDAMAEAQPKTKSLTLSDLWRGAIGAGLGSAAAAGLGTVLGVSDSTYNSMQTAGMGLGALLNTGAMKMGSVTEERRHAFRLGFLKAALEKGLLKESAIVPTPVIPLTPDVLTAPMRGTFGASSAVGSSLGAALGVADSPDETDEYLAQMKVEKELLKDQLSRLQALHDEKVIKDVLAKK